MGEKCYSELAGVAALNLTPSYNLVYNDPPKNDPKVVVGRIEDP